MKTEYYVNGTSVQFGLQCSSHQSKLEAIKKAQSLAVSKFYYYISVVSSKGEHVIDFAGIGSSHA